MMRKVAEPPPTTITGDNATVKQDVKTFSMDPETGKTVSTIVSKVIISSFVLVVICVGVMVTVLYVAYKSAPISAVGKLR